MRPARSHVQLGVLGLMLLALLVTLTTPRYPLPDQEYTQKGSLEDCTRVQKRGMMRLEVSSTNDLEQENVLQQSQPCQQDSTKALCELHDKCVFVASTGRSGSTNLQDALNQIPGVFVRGENNGLFQDIINLSDKIAGVMREADADIALADTRPRVAADAKEEYEQYVAAQLKTAWVNSWPKGSAQCTASLIFKQLYGAGVFRDYIVGFKDVRFNAPSGITSYAVLERHLDFLLGLCKNSRIVLNLRRDIKATARSGHFQGKMSKEWENILADSADWFQQYAAAHPGNTFVAYYEDMFDAAKNQTLAEDLMQFIQVEKTEINFARLQGWWPYPKGAGD